MSLDHYDASNLAISQRNRPDLAVELPGVDVEHFRPSGPTADNAAYGIPSDARVVLFCAALDRAHHFKRLDWLLQGSCTCQRNVWLLVVGDGDYGRL